MLKAKEIKQISREGMNKLDDLVYLICSGRLSSDTVVKNNILELIQMERLDAAAMAIEKFDF